MRAWKRHPRLLLVIIAMPFLGALAGAQGVQKFQARLSRTPVDATMQTTVTGIGSVTAELTGTKLTISGTFSGLKGPATVARLHYGSARGVRGVPIGDLTASKATSGTISGSIDLTPARAANLSKGWFYVQLNSESAPDGNLWGWLLPEANRK